jgi:TPR repeat protein
MENLELYLILGLIVFTLWFILNTKKFYFGEKRKVKNLHHFAKAGDVDAQQKLAQYYQKGEMVKKSCDHAAFWYQRAAFSGDKKAKGYLQKFLDEHKNKRKC